MPRECELSDCKWCGSGGTCQKEDLPETGGTCRQGSVKSCFERASLS